MPEERPREPREADGRPVAVPAEAAASEPAPPGRATAPVRDIVARVGARRTSYPNHAGGPGAGRRPRTPPTAHSWTCDACGQDWPCPTLRATPTDCGPPGDPDPRVLADHPPGDPRPARPAGRARPGRHRPPFPLVPAPHRRGGPCGRAAAALRAPLSRIPVGRSRRPIWSPHNCRSSLLCAVMTCVRSRTSLPRSMGLWLLTALCHGLPRETRCGRPACDGGYVATMSGKWMRR